MPKSRDEGVRHDWCCREAWGLEDEAAKGVWVQGLGRLGLVVWGLLYMMALCLHVSESRK